MNGISVIICCYNAAGRIEATLRHLQKQRVNTPLQWEVILVDNASTDATSRIAEETWNQHPVTRLKIIREDQPGLQFARMKGLSAAEYEIVSFIDDDNWADENWIEKVNETFTRDETIGACGGKIEAVFEKDPPEWFPFFENSFAVGSQAGQTGYIEHTKGYLWGAGLSLRRSIWKELQKKEFNSLTTGRIGTTLYAGDDTELCFVIRLLGYRLYYREDLLMKHYLPASRLQFSYLLKLHNGFGKSFVSLNCYRVLLSPGQFQMKGWIREWLSAVKKIFLVSVQIFFAKSNLERWRMKTIKAYWKGYASQTWHDKNKTQKRIDQLRARLMTQAME